MLCRVLALAACLSTATLASPAFGASVRETSLAEMLGAAAFIFEGEVLARGCEEVGAKGILTWVEFSVHEVLKGPATGGVIRLEFLGGEVGERRVVIGGMRIPSVGERGLYFVESLTRRQVHPLYGWDQGRLRLVRDATGADRVLSAEGDPIVAVGPRGGSGAGSSRSALSRGVARGLETAPGSGRESAMTAWALKAELRRQLAGIR